MSGIFKYDEFKDVNSGEVPVRLPNGSWNGIDPTASGAQADMFKAVYDTNDSGIVDNSEKLGNEEPAYYKNTSNMIEGTNLFYTETRVNNNTNVANATTHITRTDNPHSVTKTQVGLSNVQNVNTTTTSNVNEGSNLYYTETRVNNNANVSAATTHIARTDNPHSTTKSQVGLSNVDNTSDVNKPVSTLQREVFNTLDANGVVSGMQLSINADATKIDISPGTFHCAVNGLINFTGMTGVTITNLTTSNASYIAYDPINLILIQQTTYFTATQRRDYVILGAAIHSNKTVINVVNNLPDVAVSYAAQLNDLMDGLKNFNKEGNVISANGANLYINKSEGKIFKKGVNFKNDTKNPNIITLTALTAPSNIRYRLSDGTEYVDTNQISLYYESSAGVRTAATANRYTIQRVVLFPSNLIRIQYGTTEYKTLELARQAIGTEPFTIEQNMGENGLLRCYLIVQGNASNLADTTQAQFIHADIFGQLPVGSGGGASTLQQAYNNSETPEIVTDTTRGAVSFKRGSLVDTDAVTEILNGAGITRFSVDGNGNVTTADDLTLYTPSQKTLKLSTPVYKDINIGGTSLGTGPAEPSLINLDNTNIKVYAMSGTNPTPDELYGSFELQHDYKEGTPLHPHIHFLPTTSDAGNVKFFLEYYLRDDNALKLTGTLSSVSSTGSIAWQEIRTEFGTISNSSIKIGSQIFFRLYRDAADVQDTYSFDVALSTVGIHYEIDTVGSRQIAIK